MTVFDFAANYVANARYFSGGGRTCFVHVHVPKAAGTSLTSLMMARFGPASASGVFVFNAKQPALSLDRLRRKRFRAVTGHIGADAVADLMAAWPDLDFRFSTVLREPVDRLLSAYRHVVAAGLRPPKLSEIDPRRPENFASTLWNTQARLLAHGYQLEETPPADRFDVEYLVAKADRFLQRCEIVGAYEARDTDFGRILSQMGAAAPASIPTLRKTPALELKFDAADIGNARAMTEADRKLYGKYRK